MLAAIFRSLLIESACGKVIQLTALGWSFMHKLKALRIFQMSAHSIGLKNVSKIYNIDFVHSCIVFWRRTLMKSRALLILQRASRGCQMMDFNVLIDVSARINHFLTSFSLFGDM